MSDPENRSLAAAIWMEMLHLGEHDEDSLHGQGSLSDGKLNRESGKHKTSSVIMLLYFSSRLVSIKSGIESAAMSISTDASILTRLCAASFPL